jgi:hypothetical protein
MISVASLSEAFGTLVEKGPTVDPSGPQRL